MQYFIIKIKYIKLENNFKIDYDNPMEEIIENRSDEEIIEYSSFLVIIEDILETFPIKTVELIFDILESNLKKKPSVSVN